MHRIQVYTLQTPCILSDGKPIVFPYRKAEALFYYLAVEKSVTRNAVSYLLWEDSDTETAHKNLRHALYTIKKLFGFEVITSPRKLNLSFSPDIMLECDADTLFEQESLKIYENDFLSDFTIKNTAAYQEWLEQKREHIKAHYLIKLYDHIHSLSYNSLSEIELSCLAYTKADPYDERIVYALLKAYHANKLYLKGINAYQKLHKEMREVLGIVPGQEITDLYRQLRLEWVESSGAEDSVENFVVRGRKREVLLLTNTFHSFIDGKVQVVMVSGENGIGKTFLVQSLYDSVKSEDVLILSAHCYSQERNTLLYPWNSIILQLDNYIRSHDIKLPSTYIQAVAQFFPTFGNQIPSNGDVSFDISNALNLRGVQNGIFRILSFLTEKIPILLLFDNLHFGDRTSRHLISSLVHDLHSNFMVVFTTLEPISTEMLEFAGDIQKDNLLTHIHLNRFSREDMLEIISASLDIRQISPDTLDKIYEETSGNAFFLMELINAYKEQSEMRELSINAKSILAQRLSDLSLEAKQILDIISLFHDYASLDILEKIFGGNPMDMMNSLEELKMRALLKEKLVHNEIRFTFTHSKMREYVNSQIPLSKQRVLCNTISNALEQTLPRATASYYNKLIHYFSLAGNTVKTLMYQIYQFEDISITLFELYPSQISEDTLSTPDNLPQYFGEIERKLRESKNKFYQIDLYDELYARLLIAKGRYSIMSGLYYDGLVSMKEAFQLAYVQENSSYMLSALRQMVYYGIQLDQPELMEEYIQKGLSLSEKNHMWLEYALFLRLNGLLEMMRDHYESCALNLTESISLLETHSVPSNIRIINTSAAYNYFGEMERRKKNYDKAIHYYLTSVDLCQSHNINLPATYYTNIGCAYYEKNQKDMAYKNFFLASEIYDNSFSLMGRSVAKGYCALYHSSNKDFDSARTYLAAAINAADRLGSPIEKEILQNIQEQLQKDDPKEFNISL